MGIARRTGPLEALRNLALSLERLAASEAASGAVRGAADGLRDELPEFDGQLRSLIQDVLTVLGRLAHDAAEREQVEPAAAAHALAGAAMEGALEALQREWRDGGLPLHAFMVRLGQLFDEAVKFAHSRTEEIHAPGERAQVMARGVVKAATAQLHESLPLLTKDVRALAPLGEEVAARVGRGLVAGIESKLREDSGLLVGWVERAGQDLVRGLAAGLREELAASPGGSGGSGEALTSSLERLAERTAAATVRGAGGALADEGRRWREVPRNRKRLRRASREVTVGALEALGARLRRPLLTVAGAGSALVALTVLSLRWRDA
ncbi:hypothetical protein [Corallococcus sp. Z5C101001]|uniref:hypothetical protein n=1 Tax=Corallococcus sp. Z5C101001 TaxID=2596829 RepID=UPI00117FB89D|nr:hypothetical protein [Corallococcus sp. Z5C101001]TSC32414.1 hypothetical protein FOF48_10270 [Corallococcus sp. Z5C101001]